MPNRLSNSTIWPQMTFHGISLLKMANSCPLLYTEAYFPLHVIQYLASICNRSHLKLLTFELTLSLASRYLKKKGSRQFLQLILITSAFIASKMFQKHALSLQDLHSYSNHSFTSKDIFKMENSILKQINYDVLAEGLPDRKIRVLIGNIRQTLSKREAIIFGILEDLQRLFWSYLYSKKIALSTAGFESLPAVLIQMALVISTQRAGRFIQTSWACHITKVSQSLVYQLAEKFLKMIAGEKSLQFNF